MADVTGSSRPRAVPSAALVVVVAVASAVAAALSPARPVGVRPADVAWCALLGFAVPIVASAARRGPLAVLGIAAAVIGIGGTTAGQAAAVLSLVVVGVITFTKERTAVEAALLGGFAVQALLRGPSYGFLGLPTIVGALVLVPVAVSAWRASSPQWHRRAAQLTGAAVAVVVLAVIGAGAASLLARSDLLAAADHAEQGLDQVRAGQTESATTMFDTAREEFDTANGLLAGPLTWAGRYVPVVGQHVEALSTASDAGERLADTAATTTSTADYRSITPSGGVVDLAQLDALSEPVAATVPVIDDAVAALAAVESPWIVAPVTRELDRLADELRDTGDTARIASQGLAVAPQLLGADGPRRYLLAFSTPAESRNGGGLVGAYAVLLADQGRLAVESTGSLQDLEAPGGLVAPYAFEPPPDWQERYGDLHVDTYVVNSAASPDWPTDAGVLGQLFPQTSAGVPVDGAVYTDPAALAGLLALTGPIEVPGIPVVLDAGNAEQYLLQDQYVAFGDDDALVEARRESLGTVAEATFAALTSRPLPDLGTMVDVLGPLVAGGHLRISVDDPAGEAFFDDVGLSGRWTVRPGADVLSVRSADRLGNKIDSFLHRDITVDTSVNPDSGMLRSTVTVVLRNDSPPGGLPTYMIGNDDGYPTGTNLHLLTLYTPHQLRRSTLDDVPIGVQRQRQFDLPVYSFQIELAPESTRTLVIELDGIVAPGAPYVLDVLPQATANPDTLRLSVSDGGEPQRLHDGPLTEPVLVQVPPWAE
jgi:hypothetical protein